MTEKEMLEAVIRLLETNSANGCNCGKCCSCSTEPAFEQSAMTFSQRASAVAASAMETFQERTNVQSAALIRLQGDLTLNPPSAS